MKKRNSHLLAFIAFLSTLFLFNACSDGGDSEDGGDSGTTDTSDSYWKFADITYNREGSSQEISGGVAYLVASTLTDSNGAFTGSSITAKLFDRGTGEYLVVTEDSFATALAAGSNPKLITLSCNIGIGVLTGSSSYDISKDDITVKADVTKDASGQYHITIKNPLTLTKSIDISGGVAGSKQSYDFTSNNIY